MKLYKQFFLYDPNEEGTIEYWKNAIAFYDKLDDKDKEILFSIIKSTDVYKRQVKSIGNLLLQ